MIKGFEKRPEEFVAAVKAAAESGYITGLAAKARAEQNETAAFAAVYLAVKDGIGLTPFDSQIIAGGYLDDENVVELATGEGKTIAAVFAAFLSVCRGERVHILTFNDYLAKRDREWMKPIYDLLGVSTAYITEKSTHDERKAAYGADVLYITVKECGFDFLRDFLVFSPDEAVGCKCVRAIVDEADSLLIDEARIPLVAAGIMDAPKDAQLPEIFEFAKSLNDEDHAADEGTAAAYLTASGEEKAEERFGVENIYDEENNELLAKINDSLKALYVLTEDKDYIVKDGTVRIIDAFTGRIAENRCFPGLLQSAVELKHGLEVTERGVIMGSIPIQFFLRQYGRVSGMTGTALSAKDEFSELYGLIVKHVDPNTPSIREDKPMAVYYDEESKLAAVAEEIRAAHEKGQPVLVGTADISQSERLSALLDTAGIAHNVLNAKNDESEAEIIRNAGMPGAVTVSTNMAGRGVDIKLGGADEKERDKAVETGGLYAIGTFLAESERINDQLRGRAARQGDPGQSRLFVSLDEKIMTIHKLKKLIPSHKYPEPTTDEITEKTVLREVARIQRISQGKALDERVRLLKFTMIGEKHRELTFSTRRQYLTGEKKPTIWQDNFAIRYDDALMLYGEERLADLQRDYITALINVQWSRYLEFSAALREGIHLSVIGGKNPTEEYNIECEEYFGEMGEALIEDMGKALDKIIAGSPDVPEPPKPKRIYTYLLEDPGDELERRSLAEALMGEIDYDEYGEYYDEYRPSDSPKKDKTEKTEKKGFFAKMFGKRD